MKTYLLTPCAVIVSALLLSPAQTHAATINLATPVSNSVSVDKLNWKFDEPLGAGTTAANSATSGTTYNGTLNQGAAPSAPTFVAGVNNPGTSGYNNAVNLTTTGTSTSQNSSVSWAAASTSDTALDLVGEDFTGGAWINFNSINAGSQRVIVMNRGTFNFENSFSFGLLKSGASWYFEASVGDGSTHALKSLSFLSATGLTAGDWNHFGFIYDYNSGGDDVVTFYFNGADQGSLSFTQDITIIDSQRKFFAGERSVSTYGSIFDGKFDDMFLTSGINSFVIPEPSVAGLFLMGGMALLAARSRRIRARSAQST